MDIHTVLIDKKRFRSFLGTHFSPRSHKLLVPVSVDIGEKNVRDLDVYTFIDLRTNPNGYINNGWYSKKRGSGSVFADKEPENNQDKMLLIVVVYGHAEIYDNNQKLLDHKVCGTTKKLSEMQIFIFSVLKTEDLSFKLRFDDSDDGSDRSIFIKPRRFSPSLEIIDLLEENHRHRPQPKSCWQRALDYLWKQVCNATYNYFHPWGKWRS